jgi:hypothetical protein
VTTWLLGLHRVDYRDVIFEDLALLVSLETIQGAISRHYPPKPELL